MGRTQENLRALWRFLWDEDSLASWLAASLVVFTVIYYFFYPGLGLVLGTTHPVVAVISGSMEHDGSFAQWWESTCFTAGEPVTQAKIYADFGISLRQFQSFPFANGFNTGDLMVLRRASDLTVGEVIVFNRDHVGDPVIHRVVAYEGSRPTTKGDRNCHSASEEQKIPPEKLIGKAWFRIPYLGYVKLLFLRLLDLVGVI